MSDARTLGPWLRRFLTEHIVTERNLAHNTQKSYRDTFALLLPFVGARVRKPVDRLALQDLDARRVLQFLSHLEDDRGCSAQTRNQRLTAIRAFARFVASRDPGHLEWSSNIRAIALKKAAPQPIGWLSKTEMKALLEVPDHLRNDVLEDLRLLTNFAMDSENRMCLILVGLTELRRRLSMAVHESLAQRLVVRHHLTGLQRDEVDAYVRHRLRLAGCELPLFEEAAVEALFQATRGLPRQINRIAHYALSAAALETAKTVNAEHLQNALDELQP